MSGPIDFAALRRERESRHPTVKRERSISPPPTPRKAPKLHESTTTFPSGARLTSFTSTVAADQTARKSAVANAANERLKVEATVSKINDAAQVVKSHQGEIVYPHGVVKKTWAFGHDRVDDIKLEEVLEPLSVRTAVLSAFQWDIAWVLSKLKVPATKCIFVMQGKEAGLRQQMYEDTAHQRSWLRLCFPPMEGQTNCMHSKLMLLFHANKLRIAIPTANLLNFDWGETGQMENSVFLIDLPRLDTPQDRSALTAFGEELMFFLDKQRLDQDVKDGILNFDFSATTTMAFVSSIGGISAGEEAQRSGLQSLSKAVQQLGQGNSDVQLDFAASSIGNLNDDQLKLLHTAACGQDVFAMQTNAAKQKAATFFNRPTRDDHSIRDKIRIYFPTAETVQSSTAGAAGTICLSRQYFEDMRFPRCIFRDYRSSRAGLLSHNKIMYVRPTATTGHSWVYVGSANMSESAWGKTVFNKKEKRWHINCRNWECGVLLPAADVAAEPDKAVNNDDGDETESEDGDETESESSDHKPAAGKPYVAEDVPSVESFPATLPDLSTFDKICKPPFEYPAAEYGGREPWYFKE